MIKIKKNDIISGLYKGRCCKLARNDMQSLYSMIVDTDPRQMNFTGALWTKDMIRELISRKLDIQLSLATVTRVLNKLGLSPRYSGNQNTQIGAKIAFQWVNAKYSSIKKEANQAGVGVFFISATSGSSEFHTGYLRSEEIDYGRAPKINLLVALGKRGKLTFMATESPIDTDLLCDFLERLIMNFSRPTYLIINNNSVQRSKKIRSFIRQYNGSLKLFNSNGILVQ